MGYKIKLDPISHCARKKNRYYSIHEANLAITSLVWRHGNYKSPEGLRPYYCAECEAYHVGHPEDPNMPVQTKGD